MRPFGLMFVCMFGSSKPVVFERYGRRRSRWRLPRWLLLLLLGLTAGAAAVFFVQERYLPPRLSAQDSASLRTAFAQADTERQDLRAQLARTRQELEATQAAKRKQDDELAAPRAAAQRLRDDMAAMIAALPPDPRGGAVEVRAARFEAQGNALAYDLVLTRARDASKPVAALVKLNVAGQSSRGSETSVALDPVEASIGAQALVRGSLALPVGFKPRQVTVQVVERAGNKPLGMRVLAVK